MWSLRNEGRTGSAQQRKPNPNRHNPITKRDMIRGKLLSHSVGIQLHSIFSRSQELHQYSAPIAREHPAGHTASCNDRSEEVACSENDLCRDLHDSHVVADSRGNLPKSSVAFYSIRIL